MAFDTVRWTHNGQNLNVNQIIENLIMEPLSEVYMISNAVLFRPFDDQAKLVSLTSLSSIPDSVAFSLKDSCNQRDSTGS